MGRLRSMGLNQFRKKNVKNVREALELNAMDIKKAI
jgi:hypothetical protein